MSELLLTGHDLLGKTVKCCYYWPSVTEGVSSLEMKLRVKQLDSPAESKQTKGHVSQLCLFHIHFTSADTHQNGATHFSNESLRCRFRGLWHFFRNGEFNIYSCRQKCTRAPNSSKSSNEFPSETKIIQISDMIWMTPAAKKMLFFCKSKSNEQQINRMNDRSGRD